jgi:hypothetical protein
MAAENNLHRIVFILLALIANFLLYLAFSSILNVPADRAAVYAAIVAFLLTALVSYAFKSCLEG